MFVLFVQATMTVGNSLHVFKGSRAGQAQKVLRLNDVEENAPTVEDAYVVADVAHRLVQQVRVWRTVEQDMMYSNSTGSGCIQPSTAAAAAAWHFAYAHTTPRCRHEMQEWDMMGGVLPLTNACSSSLLPWRRSSTCFAHASSLSTCGMGQQTAELQVKLPSKHVQCGQVFPLLVSYCWWPCKAIAL